MQNNILHIANIENIIEVIKGKTLWSGYFLVLNLIILDYLMNITQYKTYSYFQNQEEFYLV